MPELLFLCIVVVHEQRQSTKQTSSVHSRVDLSSEFSMEATTVLIIMAEEQQGPKCHAVTQQLLVVAVPNYIWVLLLAGGTSVSLFYSDEVHSQAHHFMSLIKQNI